MTLIPIIKRLGSYGPRYSITGQYFGKCCLCPRSAQRFDCEEFEGDHVLICGRCLKHIRRPPVTTHAYVHLNGIKHAVVSLNEFDKLRETLVRMGRWDELMSRIVADKLSGYDYKKGGI